jgi:23S rRNA (uracil1939-C5)-methyltransferase
VTTHRPSVEVEVERIGSGGEGVGRLPDGRVIFIHRTAPGDLVRARPTRVAKHWARGRLESVEREGVDRAPPPCPLYDRCGGCSLQHLEYAGQLKAKAGLVVDALERIGRRENLPEPEVHASPRAFHYRNRVSFTLRRTRRGGSRASGSRTDSLGGVIAGFHRLGEPGRILDVDGRCLLPEEPIAEVWDEIRASWGADASLLPPGSELRLTLRGLQEEGVLLLVEGGRTTSGVADGAAELLGRVPRVRAIWHRRGRGDEAELLAGDAGLEELWYGERYTVDPGGFFQVNRYAAAAMHDLTLRELGSPRGKRVVDAYCGVGVYGRRMARHGARAIGIELDPGAVRMARERPVEGFAVLEGRVEERLAEALPADLVVLNPPRNGVDGAAVRLLAEARPQRIVYVSCDPATLARDVRRLGSTYRITRLQLFDLFPQTAHVETLLTLDLVDL